MTDLSKRLLDLHAQTTKLKWTNDAPGCVGGHYSQGGKRTIAICGGGELADTEDRADAAFIAEAHESVPALCAEIEDLEKEVETLRRGPTTIMGLSLAEIHELINESFTRRREFKSLRIKDHRK